MASRCSSTRRCSARTRALFNRALEEILTKLEYCAQPVAVYLFGSMARDEHTIGSDIDLFVVADFPASEKLKLQRSLRSGISTHILVSQIDKFPEWFNGAYDAKQVFPPTDPATSETPRGAGSDRSGSSRHS